MRFKVNNLAFTIFIVAILTLFVVSGCKDSNTTEQYMPELVTGSNDTVQIETNTCTVNICVYICGCVNSPGVYYFKEGTRICEAVETAGGFTEDCNVMAVNQAEIMKDGQQLYFPSINEKVSINSMEKGLVNINTAEKEELMTLPGIGESRAISIIDYRESNQFTCIDDIMNVSGIKEAAFNKIKTLICI